MIGCRAAPVARARRAAGALALVAAICASLVGPTLRADPGDEYFETVAKDSDYVAGREAVERKDWSEATRRLAKAEVRHPDNADLHNYLGYAYRNLRQLDRAFEHYRRAIALDPRHRGAHEYIGEAYLMVGDLAGAETHLAALRAICLLPCDELKDLEEAVGTYRVAKGLPPGFR